MLSFWIVGYRVTKPGHLEYETRMLVTQPDSKKKNNNNNNFHTQCNESFWDLAPYSHVEVDRRFRGAYYL
jgi:hypothetical protein